MKGADKINQQVNIGCRVKSNLLIILNCALANIVCCATEIKQVCGFLKIRFEEYKSPYNEIGNLNQVTRDRYQKQTLTIIINKGLISTQL